MLTPEFAVYAWMLPGFIFFVFPVLCIPLVLMANKSKALQPVANDKRKQPRIEAEGIFAQILSANNNYNVAINNISKDGICFNCSSDDFDTQAGNLGIILPEYDKNIPLPIKTLWTQKQGEKLSVGASIINTQEIWSELAGNMEEAKGLYAA